MKPDAKQMQKQPSKLNLLLSVVSIFVSILVCEVLVRVINNKPIFSLENWVTTKLEERANTLTAEYDSTLGWRAIPNLSLVGDSANNPDAPDYSHLRVNTNGYGYRFTGSASGSGGPRILVVGDSFTWGSEVSDTETYPAYLASFLNNSEVINAAYGGWGTDQIWLRAKDVAQREKPHVLIISPLTNDLLRNAYRRYGRAFKPHYGLDDDGKLKLFNVPVPRNSSAPRDIGWFQSLLGRFYIATAIANSLGLQEVWINHNRLNDRIHTNETAVSIGCHLAKEAKDWQIETKVNVVFVLLYSGSEVLNGERYWFTKQYVKCIEEAGLPLIDLYDSLLERSNSKDFPANHYRIWKSGAIAHMSPSGNYHVAEIIFEGLDNLGLLNK
jgi:hypothetical protein